MTYKHNAVFHGVVDFNSHAHVERDSFNIWFDNITKNFNSHAHVERDVFAFFFGVCIVHFNSHAHVERDVGSSSVGSSSVISTHTLTWSVTSAPFVRSHAFRISTHTLTWSVT